MTERMAYRSLDGERLSPAAQLRALASLACTLGWLFAYPSRKIAAEAVSDVRGSLLRAVCRCGARPSASDAAVRERCGCAAAGRGGVQGWLACGAEEGVHAAVLCAELPGSSLRFSMGATPHAAFPKDRRAQCGRARVSAYGSGAQAWRDQSERPSLKRA